MGALSFSPSPITTTPSIAMEESTMRMAFTAAPSAPSLSPRPIHREAARAAASVTRTSSMAKLRSGACEETVTMTTLVAGPRVAGTAPPPWPTAFLRRHPASPVLHRSHRPTARPLLVVVQAIEATVRSRQFFAPDRAYLTDVISEDPRPDCRPARRHRDPCLRVVMDRFVVTSNGPLSGTVRAGGAKNSALKLMAACLLADGRHELRNVPHIVDVQIMADMLSALGVSVAREG